MKLPTFLADRLGRLAAPPVAAPKVAAPTIEPGDDDSPFLARWSRRKLSVPAEIPAAPVDAEPDTRAVVPEADLAPPPELPALDTITAGTDITGFLAKGVTQAVRNAALRRMWSLDPAIRDYVGDARDYAYDWNVPGGVPGFGAIDPGYDVQGTLARMFSDPKPEGADESGGASADTAPSPLNVAPEPETTPQTAEAVTGSGERGGLPKEDAEHADGQDLIACDAVPMPTAGIDTPPAQEARLTTSPAVKAAEAGFRPDPGPPDPVPRGIPTPRHGRATPV